MSHLRYFGVFGVHKHCRTAHGTAVRSRLAPVIYHVSRSCECIFGVPPVGISSFGNKGPNTIRVSEKSDFEKASVIGSRGKLRTRIRGGILDHQRKAKMLLIRRYGTGFLWMTTVRRCCL
jgi:hypothetical protein